MILFSSVVSMTFVKFYYISFLFHVETLLHMPTHRLLCQTGYIWKKRQIHSRHIFIKVLKREITRDSKKYLSLYIKFFQSRYCWKIVGVPLKFTCNVRHTAPPRKSLIGLQLTHTRVHNRCTNHLLNNCFVEYFTFIITSINLYLIAEI